MLLQIVIKIKIINFDKIYFFSFNLVSCKTRNRNQILLITLFIKFYELILLVCLIGQKSKQDLLHIMRCAAVITQHTLLPLHYKDMRLQNYTTKG